MSHTPTPWNTSVTANSVWIDARDSNGIPRYIGSDGLSDSIAECFGDQARANAAHIVRCVNAHDDLVKALEALVAIDPGFGYAKGSPVDKAFQNARKILAKARA